MLLLAAAACGGGHEGSRSEARAHGSERPAAGALDDDERSPDENAESDEEPGVEPSDAPEASEAPASDPPEIERLLDRVRLGGTDAPLAAITLQVAGKDADTRPILRDLLWSDDEGQRDNAGRALQAIGGSLDRGRAGTSAPVLAPDRAELVDLRAWTDDDRIVASWRVHVGEEIVAAAERGAASGDGKGTFATVIVQVSGGTLDAPLETESYATPGENSVRDEVLARNVGSGDYLVVARLRAVVETQDGRLRAADQVLGQVPLQIP